MSHMIVISNIHSCRSTEVDAEQFCIVTLQDEKTRETVELRMPSDHPIISNSVWTTASKLAEGDRTIIIDIKQFKTDHKSPECVALTQRDLDIHIDTSQFQLMDADNDFDTVTTPIIDDGPSTQRSTYSSRCEMCGGSGGIPGYGDVWIFDCPECTIKSESLVSIPDFLVSKFIKVVQAFFFKSVFAILLFLMMIFVTLLAVSLIGTLF